MMNRGKLRKSVIVGCGTIAEVHAACLNQIEKCKLVAFADIRMERAEDFAGRYNGRAYASMEDMLLHEQPDVIHICTPHYLHVPMAIYALEHGVDVLMEKPPAISGEQWEGLKETVKITEKRIGICFQNRYNKSVQYVKQLLAEGTAGRILGARGIVTWYRDAPYYTESGWRGDLATEGGGALINQSIHTLDLLGYFLGRPIWVDASMANHHLKKIIEVEDMMEAYVSYESTNVVFYATTAYCEDVPPLIELVCENMIIRIEEPEVTCYYRDGSVYKPDLEQVMPLGKNYWGSGHAGCLREFYDCLENGKRFMEDMDGVEQTLQLTLALYESARAGKSITLAKKEVK